MTMEQLDESKAAQAFERFYGHLDEKDMSNLEGILAQTSNGLVPENLKDITDDTVAYDIIDRVKTFLEEKRTMKLIPENIAAANKKAKELANYIEEKRDEALGF